MPYDEETRKLIENRKRNAEYRKAQQIKKRKMTLAGLGVIIALLVVLIIVAASCSAKNDEEIETNPTKETIILGETTQVETVEETTKSKSTASESESTTVNKDSTKEDESMTDATKEDESAATKSSAGSGSVKYTKDAVNLRKEADSDSTILDVLEKNEKVEVLDAEGEWTHVKWGDLEGYVSSEYLKDK